MDVLKAIESRFSARAFLDKPVARDTLEEILRIAGHAPSGVNTQPWQVVIVTGKTKQSLSELILKARANNEPQRPDYHYYPENWVDPYKARRKECGMALYGALKISKEDHEKRLLQWNRNYTFFGAPIGLLFFIDGRLETGSWLDCGMFIQNVMLAAREFNLHTCPQASISEYPDLVRKVLNKPEELKVICGMALGYADESQLVNQYRTTRLPLDEFTQWFD